MTLDVAATQWEKAQRWERDWWDGCINTHGEEEKQLLYADRMGLTAFHDGKSPYNFDLGGALVLDIGGGPCSLLLKCRNVNGMVIDPLSFPSWILARYEAAGVEFVQMAAEDLDAEDFDEAWIYNVLQHVRSPEAVIANARNAARFIRIFEWIDTPTNEGHPHSLTETWLNEQLCGEGKVERFNGQAHCWGKAYYGVFPTT